MILQEFVHRRTYIQHPILVFFLFCRHETGPQNSVICFTGPYSSKKKKTHNEN